jgi:hypothetical protein
VLHVSRPLLVALRADQPERREPLAGHLSNRERLALLMISLIAMLTIPALLGPAPSQAAGQACAPIVRKGDGDFYKARVSILQGAPSCEEARELLWTAMRWNLVVTRNGWECHPRNLETVFQNQKCVREEPGSEREVIQSSVPRQCPSCTATKK